jgi:2-dehydro-3-deoxyphosphooctonate aldolase (KDO 8-P synthase)
MNIIENEIDLGTLRLGGNNPLFLISGPCVIEDFDKTYEMAARLKEITQHLEIPFIFKSSFDKANRTSFHSYRGPGLVKGLEILARIKTELEIPVLSDVHQPEQAAPAAEVLDIIQIPALLCRQTDLIAAVAQTGKIVNIKKGQFLTPWDIGQIIEKAVSSNNRQLLLTERGTTFGYHNLVVDFRSIPIMRQTGYPVVFDATHSVQLPGGQGSCSGGQREFAPVLARSAVAAGADGIFMEIHTDPEKALCDGPNSIKLDDMPSVLSELKAIRNVLRTEKKSPDTNG